MIENIAIEPGALPEKHELKTATFLSQFGKVKFLAPSQKEGEHTPDILWLDEKWEIKSPKGKGRWLLENTLQTAVKQSSNIIVDLQRIKIHQTRCLRQLEKQFNHSKGIKKLKVITKSHKIIDFGR